MVLMFRVTREACYEVISMSVSEYIDVDLVVVDSDSEAMIKKSGAYPGSTLRIDQLVER
jgi:hypothetical protein